MKSFKFAVGAAAVFAFAFVAGSAKAACYDHMYTLKQGSTGAQVMAMQSQLGINADGSFGPMTKASVMAFQASKGLGADGVVGPMTGAAMEASCSMTGSETGSNTGSETGSNTGSTSNGTLSGEASFDSLSIDSASDSDLEEGAEEAEVAEITLEYKDGDAKVTRMDIAINDTDLSTDSWDVLESVALMVDGKEVASMDASDEDDYQDEDTGTLRFSGLNIMAMEDEETEVSVVATLQGNIDSVDFDTYGVSITSLRWEDAEGVVETESTASSSFEFGLSNAVNFDIEAAGAEDEIIAKTSTSDPDGTTLQVKDDAKSDWYTVFAFDLDTDDSTNDIELNTVQVNFITNGVNAADAGYSDLVDDVELVIDGEVIDDVTVGGTSATEGTATLTFDVDGDVTIDAGDRVKAELKARFKALISTEEGATVQGSISTLTTANIDAEGAEDLLGSQLSGSATGDVHTLRTMGANVVKESASASVTTQDGANNDYATYTMEVEVTAFDQDVFIATAPATSIAYTLENGSSVSTAPTVTVGTRTTTLTSTAEEQGAYFRVDEGDTETFTITVTYVPGAANIAARMQLDTIMFASTAAAPTQTWTASPETDYRTNVVTVVN